MISQTRTEELQKEIEQNRKWKPHPEDKRYREDEFIRLEAELKGRTDMSKEMKVKMLEEYQEGLKHGSKDREAEILKLIDNFEFYSYGDMGMAEGNEDLLRKELKSKIRNSPHNSEGIDTADNGRMGQTRVDTRKGKKLK